jgi:hypothetical protein
LGWIFYLGKTISFPGRKDRDILKCFTCLDVNKKQKRFGTVRTMSMKGGIETRRCRPIGLENDHKSDLSPWMTIGHEVRQRNKGIKSKAVQMFILAWMHRLEKALKEKEMLS